MIDGLRDPATTGRFDGGYVQPKGMPGPAAVNYWAALATILVGVVALGAVAARYSRRR